MSKPSTNPGLGPPPSGSQPASKKADTVDELLDGFGTSRSDQPRILPKKSNDITPTPPDAGVPRVLTPTEPGSRQKRSRFLVASIVAFALLLIVGIVLVKLTVSGPETPAPLPTMATATAKETATPTPTFLAPPPIDPATADDPALPVPTATASTRPATTARPTATGKPSATPSSTIDTPGLHLIKGT